MKLIFASANAGKLREAAEILPGVQILSACEAGITEDIPETGVTLKQNAIQKARYIWEKTGQDCFADDTGLEVDLLGGAPGVHTARYAGEQKSPAANIEKLLNEMALREKEASMARTMGLNVRPCLRSARFRTCVCLILGGKEYFFDGVMEGRIARERSGKGGFGYDPVFIPQGLNSTAAELPEEEKNAISHRGKAMRAMAAFIESLGQH